MNYWSILFGVLMFSLLVQEIQNMEESPRHIIEERNNTKRIHVALASIQREVYGETPPYVFTFRKGKKFLFFEMGKIMKVVTAIFVVAMGILYYLYDFSDLLDYIIFPLAFYCVYLGKIISAYAHIKLNKLDQDSDNE